MSDPIIRVEKLSKRYTLGHQVREDGGLRHALENLMSAPGQWLRNRREQKKADEELEARKRKREHEQDWDKTREQRIGSWRDFQKGGEKKKLPRMAAAAPP